MHLPMHVLIKKYNVINMIIEAKISILVWTLLSDMKKPLV